MRSLLLEEALVQTVDPIILGVNDNSSPLLQNYNDLEPGSPFGTTALIY